jgi:uncharacterized membrane protein YedE/YeeE
MRMLPAYLIGLVFGIGIVLSGMANPAKVINFFDVAGSWDPSLAVVMAVAVGVTFVGYRLAWRRQRPLLDEQFARPAGQRVDARLVVGAAVFGVGWGLAGICPGAVFPALGSGRPGFLVFALALTLGIGATRVLLARRGSGSGH